MTDLADAGVEVAAVVDARRGGSPFARQAADHANSRYLAGAVIQAVRGRQSVKGVNIKDASGKTERIDCDLIAMSGGWSPTIHLTTHLNGKPVWNEKLAAQLPGKLPPGMSVAGATAGSLAWAPVLLEATRGDRGCASVRLCAYSATGSTDSRAISPRPRCGRSTEVAARPSSFRTTSRVGREARRA